MRCVVGREVRRYGMEELGMRRLCVAKESGNACSNPVLSGVFHFLIGCSSVSFLFGAIRPLYISEFEICDRVHSV